ncbi:MAG: hypothetical protein RBU37_19060 [Myxococcota bacterium]|nr:hypothetical protein [Myxococcota bacterium]
MREQAKRQMGKKMQTAERQPVELSPEAMNIDLDEALRRSDESTGPYRLSSLIAALETP